MASDWEVIYRSQGSTVVHKEADDAIDAERIGRIYASSYKRVEIRFRGEKWMDAGHASIGVSQQQVDAVAHNARESGRELMVKAASGCYRVPMTPDEALIFNGVVKFLIHRQPSDPPLCVSYGEAKALLSSVWAKTQDRDWVFGYAAALKDGEATYGDRKLILGPDCEPLTPMTIEGIMA